LGRPIALIIVVPFVNGGKAVFSRTDDCEFIDVITALVFDSPTTIICGNLVTLLKTLEATLFTRVAENDLVQVLCVAGFSNGAVTEIEGLIIVRVVVSVAEFGVMLIIPGADVEFVIEPFKVCIVRVAAPVAVLRVLLRGFSAVCSVAFG
jgi:hypothetical protein